jgi:hypothetical protein
MIAKRFNLNEEMIYLIETLKVEGYWSRKYFTLTLQNKNIPLLNRIEEIVNKLNLGINVSKRVLLKIRLEDNEKRENLRLFLKDKELNFHIEKSPFDNSKVKAVTSLPYKNNYDIVLIKCNKKFPIKIRCFKDKLTYESSLQCFLYKDLRFPTKELLDFLEDYCGDKKNFRVEEFIINANQKLIMSAFSALMDCEGTISWYGLKRQIQIRMRNRVYLQQWSELLKRYGVGNRFDKKPDKKGNWGLNIEGWEDFNRLNELGFRMYHSEKADKWERVMGGFKRNQISRNGYKEFYTLRLKELNKKITAQDFASYIKKSKRVASHYLLKLERGGLINCDKSEEPYRYFISTSSVR